MCRKPRQKRGQNAHNTICDKRGFTLVELVIVLVLLAILTTMIVSFSSLMSGYADGERAEYDFFEDVSLIKESLCTWLAENDTQSTQLSLNDEDEGVLILNNNDTVKTVSFADGVLTLGGEETRGLRSVERISFERSTEADRYFVKCTVYPKTTSNESIAERSFVFSLRCATAPREVVNEG